MEIDKLMMILKVSEVTYYPLQPGKRKKKKKEKKKRHKNNLNIFKKYRDKK